MFFVVVLIFEVNVMHWKIFLARVFEWVSYQIFASQSSVAFTNFVREKTGHSAEIQFSCLINLFRFFKV